MLSSELISGLLSSFSDSNKHGDGGGSGGNVSLRDSGGLSGH